MELLIITGMSGSGKSRAASILEDIGYYIVDNLPAEMMVKFADFCISSHGHYDRVALVYDVRAGEPFDLLIATLERLKRTNVDCRLLFLDADTAAIINRYKETRRAHPLSAEGRGIEQAVMLERQMLQPVRDHADYVVDTSSFSVGKLRSELLDLFGRERDRQGLHVDVMSFGFKHGLPLESDLVFDVRFLPNPYYIPELKNQTGLDEPVKNFVFKYQQTLDFVAKTEDLLSFLLPNYLDEGKTDLVIAVGCTGGKHRSVCIAKELFEFVSKKGYAATLSHRDMGRR